MLLPRVTISPLWYYWVCFGVTVDVERVGVERPEESLEAEPAELPAATAAANAERVREDGGASASLSTSGRSSVIVLAIALRVAMKSGGKPNSSSAREAVYTLAVGPEFCKTSGGMGED